MVAVAVVPFDTVTVWGKPLAAIQPGVAVSVIVYVPVGRLVNV